MLFRSNIKNRSEFESVADMQRLLPSKLVYISLDYDKERTCISRWFGKMEPGSLRGSILALSVSAIGGGVLSLPFVCQLCGLVLGLLLLVLGYAASAWSFSMIIHADTKGGGFKTYKEFCSTIGGRSLTIIYNAAAIFTIYGALLGYQVIISTLIQRVMMNFNVANPHNYRVYHIICVSVLIIFPLCTLRDVSKLRYATIISMISIFYTVAVVIIEMPFYWIYGKASASNIKYFVFDWSFLSAFGITFFAYMCQTGFYAATEKIAKRDPPHLFKVFI